MCSVLIAASAPVGVVTLMKFCGLVPFTPIQVLVFATSPFHMLRPSFHRVRALLRVAVFMPFPIVNSRSVALYDIESMGVYNVVDVPIVVSA